MAPRFSDSAGLQETACALQEKTGRETGMNGSGGGDTDKSTTSSTGKQDFVVYVGSLAPRAESTDKAEI